MHLRYIRWHLRKVTDGEVNKLMLFVPPRHGKSEMTTVRYAAWRLERDPSHRVIIAAYNQTLANKFSRKVRKISIERGLPIDPARTAINDWETLAGGGLRAVGVGGGVTGMGGNLIVIDDPVKNREEANSLTYREKVWSWYTDDLYTRLEPGGQIVLIITRWHEDDLAGRILASDDAENWHVVMLPAIAEAGDALGRKRGEALCPERYDTNALDGIKTAIGPRAFTALYQQRPIEQEGGMFKRSWFRIVDTHGPISRAVRYWDKAATANDGDWTVGVKMARLEDETYLVTDVVRGQWSPLERDNVIERVGIEDGPAVTQFYELEPGSSGVDSAAYLSRRLAGLPIRFDRVTGDKATRAEPFSAQCEAGNVALLRAPWNGAYINELCGFPQASHDDQVDASSGAFNEVAAMGSLLLW